MPSLFSRFRPRTRSTSAGSSPPTNSGLRSTQLPEPANSAPVASLSEPPILSSSSAPQPPQLLSRKIHPNLNELVGSFEADSASLSETRPSAIADENFPRQGLSPSKWRRHSADSSTLPWTFQPIDMGMDATQSGKSYGRQLLPLPRPPSTVEEADEPPPTPAHTTSTFSSPRSSRILPKGKDWSTFGRRKIRARAKSLNGCDVLARSSSLGIGRSESKDDEDLPTVAHGITDSPSISPNRKTAATSLSLIRQPPASIAAVPSSSTNSNSTNADKNSQPTLHSSGDTRSYNSDNLHQNLRTTPPKARLRPLLQTGVLNESPRTFGHPTPPSSFNASYFSPKTFLAGARLSADTFGVGSPPLSTSASVSSSSEQSHNQSQGNSSHSHGRAWSPNLSELPPPLPPLDHPALQRRGESADGSLDLGIGGGSGGDSGGGSVMMVGYSGKEGGGAGTFPRRRSTSGKEREMGTFSAFKFGGGGSVFGGSPREEGEGDWDRKFARGGDANGETDDTTDDRDEENIHEAYEQSPTHEDNETRNADITRTKRNTGAKHRVHREGEGGGRRMRDSGFQEWHDDGGSRSRVGSSTSASGDRVTIDDQRLVTLQRLEDRGVIEPSREKDEPANSALETDQEQEGGNSSGNNHGAVLEDSTGLSARDSKNDAHDKSSSGEKNINLNEFAGGGDRSLAEEPGLGLGTSSNYFLLLSPSQGDGDVLTHSTRFGTPLFSGKELITPMPRHDPTMNTPTPGPSVPQKSALKSSHFPSRTSPSPPESSNTHSSGRQEEDAGPFTPLKTPSRGSHPHNVQFTSTPTIFAPPSRRIASEPTPSVSSGINLPETPLAGKGKRKADADITPPERKDQRATFAVPTPDPRSLRTSATSGSSHAPSSYGHGRKRARLSSAAPLTTPPATPRSGSRIRDYSDTEPNNNFGSLSSRGSGTRPGIGVPARTPSRVSRRSSFTYTREAKSSMSARSIPISALVSPHAPSVIHSGQFHMRDPHKPPRKRSTGWSLKFPVDGESGTGSPLHAWLFFLGFVIFPIWWVAALLGTPKTRRAGGEDVEKAVVIDDPQVEYDAKSWRTRCRIMAAVSLVTYVPFIVCVGVFAHR